MFSKEEHKQLREQFWTMFGKRYNRKWLLYKTGIKDLHFRFSFEDGAALVSLELLHKDEVIKAYYFEKLEELKTVLSEYLQADFYYDRNNFRDSEKKQQHVSMDASSRVYVKLEGVKIERQTDWPMVFEFFYTFMSRFEEFFEDYKEIFED